MAVVFGAVLLCSMGFDRLFSPAGDAVVSALDHRPVTVTGTVAASRADAGKLALFDGPYAYVLSDQVLARTYAGREVTINGILHDYAGTLDVQRIESVNRKTSRNLRP